MVDYRVMRALDSLAGKDIEFADARFYRTGYQGYGLFDNDFIMPAHGHSRGFACRVLKGGWGHAKGSIDNPEKVAHAALERAEIAGKLNEIAGHTIRISPARHEYKGDHYGHTTMHQNPFAIPPKSIHGFLLHVSNLMDNAWVKTRDIFIEFEKVHKHYANTDGVRAEQDFCYVNGHMSAGGTHKGTPFSRSYDGFCLTAQGGYELVDAWDFPANAERITRELQELMLAPACPEGQMDVILDPSQLYLQVHENGHGFELDRILGYEIAFAGGSFITPEMIGRLRYGSDKVNIVADAGDSFGAGTFDFDDEGTPAQKIYLVKNGILTNVLSSRETAMEANLPKAVKDSTGAMRAESSDYPPLIRMTNVLLEEGPDGTLDDIISRTEQGLLLATNKTWSIDNWRRNFHFETEVGWIIEDGKRKHMVRHPSYTGETVSFWNSCDMVGSEAEVIGVSNCGKGQPCQTMYCGHPSPPARFKDVQVGVKAPDIAGGGTGCAIADPAKVSGMLLQKRGVITR